MTSLHVWYHITCQSINQSISLGKGQPYLRRLEKSASENDIDIMTKNQQGQHYMYAKSKLVYTVQEMNKKKAIEDIEDEETGRMLES